MRTLRWRERDSNHWYRARRDRPFETTLIDLRPLLFRGKQLSSPEAPGVVWITGAHILVADAYRPVINSARGIQDSREKGARSTPPRGQIIEERGVVSAFPPPAPVIPQRLSPLSPTRVEEHNHTVVAIAWVPGLFTSNYGVSAY